MCPYDNTFPKWSSIISKIVKSHSNGWIFVLSFCFPLLEWYKKARAIPIVHDWVIECISQHKLISFYPYLQELSRQDVLALGYPEYLVEEEADGDSDSMCDESSWYLTHASRFKRNFAARTNPRFYNLPLICAKLIQTVNQNVLCNLMLKRCVQCLDS